VPPGGGRIRNAMKFSAKLSAQWIDCRFHSISTRAVNKKTGRRSINKYKYIENILVQMLKRFCPSKTVYHIGSTKPHPLILMFKQPQTPPPITFDAYSIAGHQYQYQKSIYPQRLCSQAQRLLLLTPRFLY
jgi:hypothetical protein